jgi:hypothetical protein
LINHIQETHRLEKGLYGEYLDLRGWKKQQDLENCVVRSFILYSLPNIIRVIKLKRIRWVRLAAQVGEKRNEYMRLW